MNRTRRTIIRISLWLAIFGTPGIPALAQQAVALPDRIILTPIGDPATSAAVTWRGPADVPSGSAQIAIAPPGIQIEKAATTLTALSAPFDSGVGMVCQHSIRFTGLKPDTLYAYRVANGTAWSEWFHFRTAATKPRPFTFLYLGDTQTELRAICSRAVRQALRETPDVRLILHAGDLTNRASNDVEWGDWFGMAGYANASILNVPAIGNHQYERIAPDSDVRRLTAHWRAQFTLPEHGVAGVEESSYHFDFQGVRFIVLNSMEKTAEQTPWLEALLKDNPNRWTVVLFHHPIYSGAKGRDNPELRAAWKPLFDRYRVDLVLTGHDHVYGRSNPKKGPAAGHTVYITSVVGTKQYKRGDRTWAARYGQDLQLYQIIRVNGDRLSYEARKGDGTLYDAFEMRKRGSWFLFTDKSRNLGPESIRQGE